MILKASQRSGGADLATHLMNEYDNEQVDIAEVRGTVANDLHGAFAEYEAMATGTRCKQPLYSLSINPAQSVDREIYNAAINRIEKHLGLSEQPRAVVFHVKNGREHCHVIWSRIKAASMTAVQLSHDHLKLQRLAFEIARDYGLETPKGKTKMTITFAEKAQAEATGITPAERRRAITEIFNHADTPKEFQSALEQQGYVLAKGDKRAFVVIDQYGETHSLARQIEGARTKHIKARLSGLSELPTAELARAQLKEQSRKEKITAKFNERIEKDRQELKKLQAKRRSKFMAEGQQLEILHRQERLALHAAQKSETGNLFNRVASKVFALICRMPALRSVIGWLHINPLVTPQERHRLENEALMQRHTREKQDFERRMDALDSVERRENRSLETKYRRMQRVTDRKKQGGTVPRMTMIRENMKDITASPGRVDSGKRKGKGARKHGQAIVENASDMTAARVRPEQFTGEIPTNRQPANTPKTGKKTLG